MAAMRHFHFFKENKTIHTLNSKDTGNNDPLPLDTKSLAEISCPKFLKRLTSIANLLIHPNPIVQSNDQGN